MESMTALHAFSSSLAVSRENRVEGADGLGNNDADDDAVVVAAAASRVEASDDEADSVSEEGIGREGTTVLA